MLSSEAAKAIARHREGCVVVATMTTIFTFAQEYPDPLNVRCAPLMGGASSIGLGIALARPDTKVIVLDGDGSLLMQLGSLATIASAAPRNLYHVLFENRVLYEGGGRLPTSAGTAFDFEGMARAAGYRIALSFDDAESLDNSLPALLESSGPVFVRLSIDVPPTPGWSNENPQGELPDWWFRQMGDDAELVRATLAGLGTGR